MSGAPICCVLQCRQFPSRVHSLEAVCTTEHFSLQLKQCLLKLYILIRPELTGLCYFLVCGFLIFFLLQAFSSVVTAFSLWTFHVDYWHLPQLCPSGVGRLRLLFTHLHSLMSLLPKSCHPTRDFTSLHPADPTSINALQAFLPSFGPETLVSLDNFIFSLFTDFAYIKIPLPCLPFPVTLIPAWLDGHPPLLTWQTRLACSDFS